MKTISACHEGDTIKFDLPPGHYTVGRSGSANLRLHPEWTMVSGVHLSIRVNPDGSIEIRDGHNGTKSTNGTKLNNRYLGCEEWTTWQENAEIQIGAALKGGVRIEILNQNEQTAQSRHTASSNSRVNNNEITIGRGGDCNIKIEGPTISRRHCVVKKVANGHIIVDYSKNGIFVNDKQVAGSQLLQQGDELKVGTYVFIWLNGKLTKETSGKNYRVDVRNLNLPGRISGSSLSIEPGQLVAFVGGSGAGKSSLLTTIVGQNMSYQGNILINGHELRECYSAIKQEIGFVPQDDIVHADLTVEEVLRYSARLKLPDPEQQREGVERVLTELEMQHRRHARVKDLSGGQRKRVSIGVELIADPRILFLDEPTSGLDPGLDKRMMELLRRLADSGKTVALVTHATNNVMLCDQVVFLGRGGYLCYAGAPGGCGSYFGVKGDFADIYQFLEKTNDEIKSLALRFKEVQANSLPYISEESKAGQLQAGNKLKARLKDFIPQLRTLISRDIKLLSRDLTSLGLNAITAPLATGMIAIAANNRSIFSDVAAADGTTYPDALRILFVIICSTVWVGLSSSLQTIVKERQIFIRERAFNLLPEAYLASKTLVMTSQALVQAILVAIAVSIFFDAPPDNEQWGLNVGWVCFATLISIGAQALMVSSYVKNSQQASSVAPLLLIPQLVFGGVLFILKDGAKDIYPLITSRWAMRALGAYTEITGLIPGGDKGIARVAGALDYENTLDNINQSLSTLGAQAACLLTGTLLILLFHKRNK